VGRIEKMNKVSYAIAALAVAGVVFSAGLVVAQGDEEEQMTGAGGGGWFMYEGADEAMYKDTFGFYLTPSEDPEDWSMSELVLQARDVGITVHAYKFTSIVFGAGSAEASGQAWIGGLDATFDLTVADNGHRSMDYLKLVVTALDDPLTLEDESNEYIWEVLGAPGFTSLGGGQIWVYLE